jgi:hypothetical protein
MSDRLAIDEQNRQKIDDWLLALLRFAITRGTADRTAAVEFARLLDAAKTRAIRPGTFFVRTTVEVCQAIDWANDRSRILVLRRHLARIENPRLGSAFRVAVGLEASDAPRSSRASSRACLWKGLPPSPVGAPSDI